MSFKYIKGEIILSLPALPSQNFTDQSQKVNSIVSSNLALTFNSKEPNSSGLYRLPTDAHYSMLREVFMSISQ